MITNVSNLNTVRSGNEESVRDENGRFPGYTLMFAACPHCGSKMKPDQQQRFYCLNHTGDEVYNNAVVKMKNKYNVPTPLAFQHHPGTGIMELKGIAGRCRTIRAWDRHEEFIGNYPVVGPAGSI